MNSGASGSAKSTEKSGTGVEVVEGAIVLEIDEGRPPKNPVLRKRPTSRRGRRPKIVVRQSEPAGPSAPQIPPTPLMENIILHLKLRPEQIERVKHALANAADISTVADTAHRGTRSKRGAHAEGDFGETYKPVASGSGGKREPEAARDNEFYERVRQNMRHVRIESSSGKLTTRSDEPCMWTRRQFSTAPCVIPMSFKDGVYRGYGNFVNPECAAAYLFNCDRSLDDSTIWERYSLLNTLYAQAYEVPDLEIKLAGPPDMLRSGTWVEFLNSCADYRHEYRLNMPPVVCAVPQIEVAHRINFHNKKINAPNSSATTKLKLQRMKPLFNKSNTMEAFIQDAVEQTT